MRKRCKRKQRAGISKLQASIFEKHLKESRVSTIFQVYSLFFTNLATNNEHIICSETGLLMVYIGGNFNDYDYAWEGIETLQDFCDLIGVDKEDYQQIQALKFNLKDRNFEFSSQYAFDSKALLERLMAQIKSNPHEEILRALQNVQLRTGIEAAIGRRVNE